MPAIPSAKESVRDFGTGQSQPASMRAVVIGAASAGPSNQLNFFGDTNTLRDTHGEGPGVEQVANIISKGGGPVGFVRPTTSIAASNGVVTKTGTGPDITLSGSAALDARIRVEVMRGGALGVGAFRYCCDGYDGDTESERTYSETITIPSGGTFAMPGLGITLTFASGTYVVGDFYTADVECAGMNAGDLATAFAPLASTPSPWRFVSVKTSRANGDSTAHATLGAALQAQLTTIAGTSKFRRGIISADAGEDSHAAAAAALASTVATRLMFPYGMVRRATVKPFPGFAFPVTHGADVFAARAAASLLSTDLKRVRSGALEEIVKLFHDEYRTPSILDDVKVSTLRTYEHLAGYYISQARLKSPSGSDFKLWPHGIVMDVACETVNRMMTTFIGEGMRVGTAVINGIEYPGALDELDAVDIEEEVSQALISQLLSPVNAKGFSGHVSDLRFRIDRTRNVLSTGTIVGFVGMLPLAYVDYIETALGFVSELPAAAAA